MGTGESLDYVTSSAAQSQIDNFGGPTGNRTPTCSMPWNRSTTILWALEAIILIDFRPAVEYYIFLRALSLVGRAPHLQ